jgi:hypothetical protein
VINHRRLFFAAKWQKRESQQKGMFRPQSRPMMCKDKAMGHRVEFVAAHFE